jgi:hypothetical protein
MATHQGLWKALLVLGAFLALLLIMAYVAYAETPVGARRHNSLPMPGGPARRSPSPSPVVTETPKPEKGTPSPEGTLVKEPVHVRLERPCFMSFHLPANSELAGR